MHPIRLAAALAALTLASSVPAAAQGMMALPPPPLPAGTRAPAFATRTLGGKPISLRALRGKVVLLDYWATWCGPCRMATPTLQALHTQFAKSGLAVVGMDMDDSHSAAQIKPFLGAMHVTYTVTASPRANFAAARAYKVRGIPSQYLIDKKGVVRWSQAGFAYSEERDLSILIRKLLAER